VKFFKALLLALLALDVMVLTSPLAILPWRGLVVEESFLREFVSALLLTLYSSLSSTTAAVLLAIPTGYYLSRYVARRDILLSLVMTPFALFPAANGLLLLIFFVKNPVGAAINDLFKVVNDPKGVAIAQLFIGLPLGVSYFTALFSAVPRAYDEVSLTLGFKPLELLFKILIPMLKPQVVVGYLTVFTRVLGDFGASFILGGGIRGRTVTLPIFLYIAQQIGELGILSIVLVIYVITMFGIVFATYRLESAVRV